MTHTSTWQKIVLISVVASSSAALDAQQSYNPVSLVKLLVNPEAFEGDTSTIDVTGYLNRYLGVQLFLTRDHAEANDFASAVEIADYASHDISQSPCTGYVTVRATVYVEDGQPLLSDVEVIRVANTDEVCWKRNSN